MTTTPIPELPIAAWAKRINIGTAEEQFCFSPDQFGEYQEPFCKLSDALAAIKASQLPSGLIDYLRSRAAAGELGYTTLSEWADQLTAIEAIQKGMPILD